MKSLSPPIELLEQLDNNEFVLKTQQQIVRDFEKFNLFFEPLFLEIPLNKTYILEKIAEQLVQLMKEGESRLLQLLYTIDLSEKEFLDLTIQSNFLSLLSEKILVREAYKVFLRGKFNG
jgi:hypothetical protein